VGVRVRPLTFKETSEGGKSVVECNPFERTVALSKRQFTYDSVFDGKVSQSDLYDDISPPLLHAFLGGYNATVIAYGQTGSGKTYTCGSEAHAGGAANAVASEELDGNAGLIPRFMSDIFATLVRRREASETSSAHESLIDFKVTASFLEVYGEDIHDLLDEGRSSLPIREDSNGDVIVRGLREVQVSSHVEAMDVLDAGTMNRTTAATLMNLTSSRSHAVFTVNLRQTSRGGGGGGGDGAVGDGAADITMTTSRFTFVDLAGSERMKKTGAEGERAREGIRINEGLLALGNVINALADEGRIARGERVHVPYRQSKLTRLLQDALGGNSQTLFMACVSPSDTNANETLSTLRYANRARNIKNAPTRNVDATAAELRRLRIINRLLKCELVKLQFEAPSCGGSTGADPEGMNAADLNDFGVVSEDLLQREEVVAYMNRIDEKLVELSSGSTSNLTTSLQDHSSALPSSGRSILVSTKASGLGSVASPVKHDDDSDALILDFNPEEDLQIIEELLELQQHDQKFQERQRDDQDRLDDMEGEIEAQEGRLLQLREHLKVYHSMKEKYERLMNEVQSLESEKQVLAELLERAQVDPTKGCSKAIKAKLQRVEEGLASARSETRKTQLMYRQAEQEAQKCKVLERQIQELKQAKVNLIKKQREDSTRHREFTQKKTSEIHALKRREKNADKKISKMEIECQKYKSNLERSKSHCNKLSEKLKQTEVHLMRLLTKRRNDITQNHKPSRKPLEGMEQFAPIDDEVKSIHFILEKSILDKVSLAQTKELYESKVVEHGKLMASMAKEAKHVLELKREHHYVDSDGVDVIVAQILECEDTLQELQLQIELLENDMEQLKSKYPHLEDQLFEDMTDENGSALKIIAKLEGPVLRSLLWNFMESYFAAELQCRSLADRLDKKASSVQNMENEAMLQSEKIFSLTKSLDQYRKSVTSESYSVDKIHNLQRELQTTNEKLESCVADKMQLLTELEEARKALSLSLVENAQAVEKLALLHSERKITESTERTEQMLMQLQDILAAIGMTSEDREVVRRRLENCVEDNLTKMIDEVKTMRDEMIQKIYHDEHRIQEMHFALGLEQPFSWNDTSGKNLMCQLDILDRQLSENEPIYTVATERRDRLKRDAEILSIGSELGSDLQKLLQSRRRIPKKKRSSTIALHQRVSMETSREARAKMLRNVDNMVKGLKAIDEESNPTSHGEFAISHLDLALESAEPGSLSTSFLDRCEQDVKKLRLLKSERLLANTEICDNINAITKEMHAGSDEVSSIVLHGLKKRQRDISSCWDDSVARAVFRALSKKGSILVDVRFTNHLNLIHDTIRGVSQGRRLLSDTLSQVINESHAALVATAEGCGMDVGDLAQCLHDALFHLPPLSKEHVRACIDEMQMLLTAADSVAQSEVETLTVLWEGLHLTKSDRSLFWGELDRELTKIEMCTSSPFDSLLEECPVDVEEWVLKSSKDAMRVQRILGVKIFKLSRIHQEVEKLKLTQVAKNGIMSLNSELNLISAKLVEFEEKAGDKQRLLNKKVNSSSLLEEERYRKQMQGMFVAKLETLRQLLNEWESNEGPVKDDDMLSEVVQSMIQNSHRLDAWMNEKTSLMHLRTTNSKSNIRTALRPERTSSKTRPSSGPGSAGNRTGTPNTHHPMRSSSASVVNNRKISQTSTRPARSTFAGQHSRPPKSLQNPHSEREKRTASSLSTHNASHPENSGKHTLCVQLSEEESSILLPFGNLAETPTEKENRTKFYDFVNK
jgi:kinesin family protein 4/21/27